MTAHQDLERRVADLYQAEAPHRAPDRVLEQALAVIDTTRQRRELRLVPWRAPTMGTYAKAAVAAMVLIAVGALGFNLLRPGTDASVGGPAPTSSTAPSATPSIAPSPSPSELPSAPPLDETFTSTVHGLSISIPQAWTAVAATQAGPPVYTFLAPTGDWLFDPVLRDHLFIALGSDVLDGESGEAWATSVLSDPGEDCTIEPETITVDGEPGLMCGSFALTWAGDRGYYIRLHTSGDEPETGEIFDQTWFEDVLTTVQLPAAP